MLQKMGKALAGLVVSLGLLTGCGRSGSADPVPLAPSGQPLSTVDLGIEPGRLPVPFKEISGVRRRVLRDGRVFIAGQPSQAALEAFAARGVTAVVNLRTPAEMNNRRAVPFDEAQVVGELGMEYVWIPLGGAEHPYTPQAVERLEEVLKQHQGEVLLHCAVAGRATHLWVAYLIRYHGYEVDQALARGRAVSMRRRDLAGLLEPSR